MNYSTITVGLGHGGNVSDVVVMGDKKYFIKSLTETTITVRPFRWYDRLAIVYWKIKTRLLTFTS